MQNSQKKEKNMMNRNLSILTLAALIFTGCLSPDLQIPKTSLPVVSTTDKALDVDSSWWEKYNDKELTLLINETFKNNYDLQKSMLNISLARSILTGSTSDRYPSLAVQGSGDKNKTSANSYNNEDHTKYNNFSLSSILSYEVDLWGKYKDMESSSQARLLSTYAAKDTIKISLAANVAENYFNLVSLLNQVEILNKAVVVKKTTIEKLQSQYDNGVISKANLLQQQTLLDNILILRSQTLNTLSLQNSALAVLVGKNPQEIVDFSKKDFSKTLPKSLEIPAGLTSDALNNRPDIKEAEQNLIASNYEIGVAHADYFPSISLSGLLGFQSLQFSNLTNNRSQTYSYGGNISMPLLNRGKIDANVEKAKTNKELALVDYRKTIQIAFQELFDALNTRKNLVERVNYQNSYEKNLESVLDLTKKQYENGYVDYVSLMDTEYNLLLAKLNTVQLNQSVLRSGVTLYKVLGGGWKESDFSKDFNNLESQALNL
jgi:outer membrane protein, multidrug efflux system